MSTMPVVALPQWVANFAPERKPGPQPAAVQHGPLTIYHASEGCEIATLLRDADSVVLFDGYLVDPDLVAAEVGISTESSPATLVAAAFEKWGAGVFDHLEGCYLVAIWDARGRRLLLGHDALGRHPVFYACESSGIWFGSNVLALASSGHVPNRPNRLSIALATLAYWPNAGETFFERIHRLRAGHFLEVHADISVREQKYWDPLPADDEPWMSEADTLQAFEPMMIRSVSRCMALSPDSILLSGGLDSVTVATLAADYCASHQRQPVVAISGRLERATSQEQLAQSQVAQALGMPHVVRLVSEWAGDGDDVAASLEATPELPGPSRIYWVGTYMRFYRLIAGSGARVLLTGAGGDNWLGVADAHAADLLRGLRLTALARFIKTSVDTGGSSYAAAIRRLLWSGAMRPLADTLAARLAPAFKARVHERRWMKQLPGWLCPDPELKQALVSALVSRRTPATTADGRTPHNYYRHSLRSADNPYLYYEFETGYHIENACGVRLLSPYHDPQLVAFLNRVAPEVLVYGNRYKGLLRPIVERRLPQLGLARQRKDYPRATGEMFGADLRRSVTRAWSAHPLEALGRIGVVDPVAARRAMDPSRDEDTRSLMNMFAMMSADRWLAHHTGS